MLRQLKSRDRFLCTPAMIPLAGQNHSTRACCRGCVRHCSAQHACTQFCLIFVTPQAFSLLASLKVAFLLIMSLRPLGGRTPMTCVCMCEIGLPAMPSRTYCTLLWLRHMCPGSEPQVGLCRGTSEQHGAAVERIIYQVQLPAGSSTSA